MPSFFILGGRRTGTASLTHYLEQHPAISFTRPRDPAFFLREELYARGLDYYHKNFCSAIGTPTWLGESSPGYYASPQVVGQRLRLSYGDQPLKFIVLLREPVARAWSHYLSHVHHGYETRDFATALAEEHLAAPDSDLRYFQEGRYMQLFEEWQTFYPAENFLFLLSEDLSANPLAQVQRTFKWLGLEQDVPINVEERLNAARYTRSHRLVQIVNAPPKWLQYIGKQLWPEAWQRQRIRHHLRERIQSPYGALPPLDPADAKALRQRYRDEIIALSKHLGRYLSHWLDDETVINIPITDMAN